MARTTAMQKVTVSLPAELVGAMRAAVEAGFVPSQDLLIRQALERELSRLREEKLRRELQEAMQDPLFLRDLQETMEAFQAADAETGRGLADA
jgi:Arc/MetJ-type ribon-helix-helix transcriptional regulator